VKKTLKSFNIILVFIKAFCYHAHIDASGNQHRQGGGIVSSSAMIKMVISKISQGSGSRPLSPLFSVYVIYRKV
jgi:hypothetical protein